MNLNGFHFDSYFMAFCCGCLFERASEWARDAFTLWRRKRKVSTEAQEVHDAAVNEAYQRGLTDSKSRVSTIREAAKVASRFSMPGRRLHPDIAWEDTHNSVKTVMHNVAQQIAQEIRDLLPQDRSED